MIWVCGTLGTQRNLFQLQNHISWPDKCWIDSETAYLVKILKTLAWLGAFYVYGC